MIAWLPLSLAAPSKFSSGQHARRVDIVTIPPVSISKIALLAVSGLMAYRAEKNFTCGIRRGIPIPSSQLLTSILFWSSFVISPDGQLLMVCSRNYSNRGVQLWDLREKSKRVEFAPGKTPRVSPVFTPDGNLAVTIHTGNIYIINTSTEGHTTVLPMGQLDDCGDMAISCTGLVAVYAYTFGGTGQAILIYDLKTGQKVRSFEVGAYEYSANHRFPVMGSICVAIAARSIGKALLASHKTTSMALYVERHWATQGGERLSFFPSVFRKASIGVRGN